MGYSTIYMPKGEVREKHPVVIGIPGLVDSTETTRIDHILSTLADNGIVGVKYYHSGIRREGNVITCPIDHELLLTDFGETLKAIKGFAPGLKIYRSHIGVLASSIGAGIFGEYFARHDNPRGQINAFASISPLPGWNQYADFETRRRVLSSKGEIDITSKWDKEKGIQRVIPHKSLSDLTKLDSLHALELYRDILRTHHYPETLTIAGSEDKIVSIDDSKEFHRLLGGKPKNFVQIEGSHELPEDKTNGLVVDFFVKSLR